jgi:hypothetical protein
MLCLPVAAATIVSAVVTAGPLGVRVVGAKLQVEPGGRPLLQEKVMVEWKPSRGIAVSVTAVEVRPWATVAEEVEGDSVNVPTEARMFRVVLADVLGRYVESPE